MDRWRRQLTVGQVAAAVMLLAVPILFVRLSGDDRPGEGIRQQGRRLALTLGATGAAAILAALVVTWWPARRAARVDPSVLLRSRGRRMASVGADVLRAETAE
jgi:hypothetical protein